MGLDTTHNAWHGSYSGFADWRRWLAKQINIDLDKMSGFKGKKRWSTLPADDLHILLNHSDCDGELSYKDCAKIAKRLDVIIKQLESITVPDGEFEFYIDAAKQFSKGCKLAAKRKEKITFH